MFMRKKGQSTLEYALIIAVAVVALIAIMTYMRRSMLGRYKASSDSIGKQFDPTNGFQTGWQTEGAGVTVTTENRDTATGATTSNTQQGEVVTSNEYTQHGTGGPAFHGF
jgi:uncharacterized protein (UPF0333 family)